MRPQHALGDRETRVLLSVMALRHPTVRGVAREAFCAVATAHASLRVLRDQGLVDWDETKNGTLRAKVTIARA